MAGNVGDVFVGLDGLGSPYGENPQSRLIDQIGARAKAQRAAAGTRNITPRLSLHYRVPTTVTCNWWLSQGRSIQLYVNPAEMQWNLPRRGTVVKTQGGAVRNVWRNRYKNTYFDEGTVNITFQSGNILPSMGVDNLSIPTLESARASRDSPQVPPGLEDFYDFMELLDTPMLLGAGENFHRIVHHSRTFPSITLIGYFTEDSFSFSESATGNNTQQWSATFQIYRTVPRFQNSFQLMQAWSNANRDNAEEIVGAHYAKSLADTDAAQAASDKDRKLEASAFKDGIKAYTPKTIAASPTNKKIISDAARRPTANASSSPIKTDFLREVFGQNG